MAMLDGIRTGSSPGEPLDRDIYDMTKTELRVRARRPARSRRLFAALEDDHAFLTRGDVFTDDLIPHVDRLQAGERGRSVALVPAPLRVLFYYDN